MTTRFTQSFSLSQEAIDMLNELTVERGSRSRVVEAIIREAHAGRLGDVQAATKRHEQDEAARQMAVDLLEAALTALKPEDAVHARISAKISAHVAAQKVTS